MCRLFCYNLFLIPPSFGASGMLCFVIVVAFLLGSRLYVRHNVRRCLFTRYGSLSCSCSKMLTHLCRMDSFTSSLWTDPFPKDEVSVYFLILPGFVETHAYNANSVDPDQTLRSAASDLGLQCLPMSLLLETRHKWVNAASHFLHCLECALINASTFSTCFPYLFYRHISR